MGLPKGRAPIHVYDAVGQLVDSFTAVSDGASTVRHRMVDLAEGVYAVSVPGMFNAKFLHQR